VKINILKNVNSPYQISKLATRCFCWWNDIDWNIGMGNRDFHYGGMAQENVELHGIVHEY